MSANGRTSYTVSSAGNSSNTAPAPGSANSHEKPPRRRRSKTVVIAAGSRTSEALGKGKAQTKLKNERRETTSRTVYLMRHGEALDAAFGMWTPQCFDEKGNYTRQDMNMPKTLPYRRNSPVAWQQDSPLSQIGLHEAYLIGEGLRESNVIIDAIYSSPFYSCVQTCTQLLESLKSLIKPQICVEPGFFELLGWHQAGLPELLSIDELIVAGHDVNNFYQPLLTIDDLKAKGVESTSECYERNYRTLKNILDATSGNIMVIGHDTTLETCSRRLMGKAPRDLKALWHVLAKIPNCSLAVMQQVDKDNWRLMPTGRFSLSISERPGFDCTVLEEKDSVEENMNTLPGTST